MPPELPLEIIDIIVAKAITRPQSLHPTPPTYFPILFPKNANVAKTPTYNLTIAHSVLAGLVTPRSWKHLVATRDSHISNILRRPYTPSRTDCYLATTRCDIHLPFQSPARNMNRFFHSFPNLQTIIWEYPSLNFFVLWRDTACPTVNFLQIGTIPLAFGGRHLTALAQTFPNLWSLQVVNAPSVDQSMPEWTHPLPVLFQNLTVLAVGTPWNFEPSRPYHNNTFLSLVEEFTKGCLWPSLIDLKIERYVDVSAVFFERHAQNIQTLTFGSNNSAFYNNPPLFNSCTTLSTLVIQLCPNSLHYPTLPPNITRIVVLQPFLSPLRRVAHHKVHLQLCLDRIYSMPDNTITEVLCEGRDTLGFGMLQNEVKRFARQKTSFSYFNFEADLVTEMTKHL